MKKYLKIIALLLTTTLLTIGSIQAADHHGKKQGGSKMMHMLEKLDLTDAQHTAIKAIQEKQQATKVAHKEKMVPIREAMRKQVEAAAFNQAEVQKLAHEKALLIESMTVSKAQSMHEIHQLLTTEQLTKFAKMKDKMHQKMQEKHKNH